MIPTPSSETARRLRPNGPFHMPPTAQPLRAWVELIVEGSPQQPEIILRDIHREISWHVSMSKMDIANTWMARVMMPSVPTIIRYHFEYPDGSTLHEKRQTEGRNTPIYGQWEQRQFQIGVYDPEVMPPDWTEGEIVYQIFPDRFANGDTSTDRVSKGVYGQEPLYLNWNQDPEHPPRGRDFYGGDLRGIIERLDYLSNLGVQCIYLTPIFESPSNHRYDILDYFKIDPMLGTETDLIELIDKAHSHDIKIILDAVFNHCSSDSRYFNGAGHYGKDTGAAQNRESPYYRWFEFKQWPDIYDGWIGLRHMPEFVECPEVEDFFLGPQGVAIHWLQRGIDGWRTDVTHFVSDEFWRRFRQAVRDVNPTAFTVAEEWEDFTRYVIGDMFDASMNYRFAWAMQGFFALDKLTVSEFDDRLETYRRDTPPPALHSQWNLIDSHDTGRALTICGGDEKRFMLMVAFQMGYPGSPLIYYGDEVGLTGDYAESGRKPFAWDRADGSFTAYYRQLLVLKRGFVSLAVGTVETALVDDAQRLYVIARRTNTETFYLAFNASDQVAAVKIPILANEEGEWREMLNKAEDNIAPVDVTTAQGYLTFELAPKSSAWYTQAL
jgi:cyclomaltodextrinase / maltogenic alpha-amylase / neopullulanase